MGMMDAPAGGSPTPQAKPKQPTGGMMADPNAGQQTGASAPQTTTSGMTGGGQQTQPPPGAQLGDWSTVAWNEAMMKSFPGLRMQAEAARQRLGPIAAGSAEVAGNYASPTTALMLVPRVGPELSGGLHEAIKSYNSQPNWIPDWEGAKQIMKDTGAGVVAGALGHAGGAAVANPELLKLGASGVGTALAHQLPSWFPGQELMGAAGGYTLAKWAADKLASPAAQQAIGSLALGGNAALRASSPGPLWDQWMTGQ